MALSIVIPAHNAAATLAETLDSLLAQTRGDWEAIVVDDGSTDATPEVAKAYSARDKRFRLLDGGRPAEGVSAARNRGIAEATGRWLLFLDADDWIEPAFVERMVGKLEAHPGAKVAYCACRRVTPDGRAGPSWLSTEVARAAFEVFARQCPVVVHGFVLDRAFVVEQGGFDTTLRTSEDWDFWQRIARTGVAFLSVPEPLAAYRMRDGSLSSDVRALIPDARTVIERAFAPDPRVRHPAACHANGADPAVAESKEMALGYFALSCAAVDVGQGGDGSGLVLPLPDRRSNLAEACRSIILDGLMSGTRKLPHELPYDDSAFVAKVRRLLQEVERAATQPGLARLLEYTLEPEVFSPRRLTDSLVVGRTLLVRRDIARLEAIAAGPDIDRVHVEFRSGERVVARIEAPALGGLSGRDVMRLALDSVSLADVLRSVGLLRRPLFWLQAGLAAMQLGAAVVRAKLARRPVPVRTLRALAKAALADGALAVAGPPGASERELAALIAEGRALAAKTTPAALVPATTQSADRRQARKDDRRSFWEEVYRTEDPWAYGSPYEQTKYRRTLDLLPSAPIGKAIELACSEGMFTAQLAPRVGHLVASDISATALERARERCRGLANVEYRRLDLFDDELPQGLDLVVCSEVLYDLADRTALARVGGRLAAMLAPGGRLLAAHAFVLKDDPTRTGYDWGSAFGAEVIAETLATTPGLALERSLQTELYRIDLFRRLVDGETASPPQIDTVDLGPPPEPDYARGVVWDGAVARRADVQARERTDRLPILMYHRIAEDGPAGLARYRQTPAAFTGQMRWLRRHGYHAVTSFDLERRLASGRPFEGRPVLITFDDAYRDFHDVAWPILRANDFTAEVFVVSDLVGGAADWDAAYGPPAPLMGWPEIQALGAAGVRFGSHMASHGHMADLSSRDIVLEAARSRAALERALDRECRAIAAPFGEGDDRFVSIARQCGYTTGFTTDPGHARIDNEPLRLPRIEVLGGWSLDAFASAVRPEPQERLVAGDSRRQIPVGRSDPR